MPSIVRSDKWFCRITIPRVFAKSEIHKILNWIDLQTILGCIHVGDKTEKEHIHLVIHLSSQLQKQSLDVRLKNIYGVSGADYSSKPWDGGDAACSYLFHDKNYELLCNKGYNEEDIQRFVKLNDDVQKVVAVNQSRASARHVDKVIDLVRQSNTKWERREIMEEFIKRIRAGEMYEPGDFMLKRYIEEVYVKTIPEHEMNAYFNDRYNKLFYT